MKSARPGPKPMATRRKRSTFCEFYAREMLRYAADQPLTKLEGEDNRLEYIPLGVGVGDSALELSAGDHGRHDRRGGCDWQHGRAQAFIGCADHRLQVLRDCWKKPGCPPAWSIS